MTAPRNSAATFLLTAGDVHDKAVTMSQLPTTQNSIVRMLTDHQSAIEARHVLVADGNTESRQRRESELRAAGFRVSVARTGFEAIVKATCHVPDLILIDESLPDIEAAETGRLITTCPVTAHIPVVRIAPGRSVPRKVVNELRRRAG